MRRIFILAGVAAMALTGPAVSQGKGKGDGPGGGPGAGQRGPGPGGDGGPGRGPGDPGGHGQGRGPDGPRGERGPGPGDRGPGGGRDMARADRGAGPGGEGPRADRPGRGPGWGDRGPRDDGPGRGPGPDRGPASVDRGPGPAGGPGRDDGPRGRREAWAPEGPGPRGPGRGAGPDRAWAAYDERVPASRFASRRWDGEGYRWSAPAFAPIGASDCPPDFARYGDRCLVPAKARRLDPARGWADWYPARYQDDGYDWRYDDGYLYGVDRDAGGGLLGNGSGGLLAAIIPLLGGALSGGNLWPQQAADYDVPDYYDRFYGDEGRSGRYDYRHADDAVFAVDPQSQRIESIAGLLTGDAWSIGKAMPAGYDLYNIPPQYRDRYADRTDAMYRYSDGYVYQVDPRTRTVRSVSELLG